MAVRASGQVYLLRSDPRRSAWKQVLQIAAECASLRRRDDPRNGLERRFPTGITYRARRPAAAPQTGDRAGGVDPPVNRERGRGATRSRADQSSSPSLMVTVLLPLDTTWESSGVASQMVRVLDGTSTPSSRAHIERLIGRFPSVEPVAASLRANSGIRVPEDHAPSDRLGRHRVGCQRDVNETTFRHRARRNACDADGWLRPPGEGSSSSGGCAVASLSATVALAELGRATV